MRHARALLWTRRGRPDSHAPVNLPRIRSHDLRVETLRQLDRECALSAGRRTTEDEHALHDFAQRRGGDHFVAKHCNDSRANGIVAPRGSNIPTSNRRDKSATKRLERIGSLAEPEIPEDLDALSIDPDDLPDDLSEVSIGEAQLIGIQANGLALSHSRLMKLNLTESRLSRLQASDVVFESCNLSNVQLPEPAFWRVKFAGCKLSGLQVVKGAFIDVTFAGCRLDLAAFSELKFKRVTFTECDLREADFSRMTFESVRFADCNLTSAMFGRIEIERAEIRHCTLTGLRGLRELRGVAMERDDVLFNAEMFANELGVEIAPEENV
jgi:uncharacterized protein YjbI with pentapeptide repeats